MAAYPDELVEQHTFVWSAHVREVGEWAAEQIGRDLSTGAWKFRAWVDDDGYLFVLARDFEALP